MQAQPPLRLPCLWAVRSRVMALWVLGARGSPRAAVLSCPCLGVAGGQLWSTGRLTFTLLRCPQTHFLLAPRCPHRWLSQSLTPRLLLPLNVPSMSPRSPSDDTLCPHPRPGEVYTPPLGFKRCRSVLISQVRISTRDAARFRTGAH